MKPRIWTSRSYEIQQAHLDPFREIGELVDGEDAAVGARHQAVMDGQLVRQILALGDPDRVDLANQVGDRGVGGGQLLAVALLRRDPAHIDPVPLGRHAVAAGAADRRIRIVVDLTTLHDWDLFIQQADEGSDQATLRLASLTQKDDVLA